MSASSITEIREKVTGRVIGPDDTDYDEARQVFIGDVERRPALIVRASNASDVSGVVTYARETSQVLAVRSGGHSSVGYGVCDGGIVLDLSEMRSLDIDAKGRTAWVEPGLTAGAYTIAADAHGLGTGFGDTGSVGIGGLTVGGGVGYLVRKHGLIIDDLLAADVITANGELRRVDTRTHPDLLWAIRGEAGTSGWPHASTSGCTT